MTLLELSKEYGRSADLLRLRVKELQRMYPHLKSRQARSNVDNRLLVLTAMLRETREISILCERYYERGYRRNGKYTL